MTIAIAAFVSTTGQIATVSDARISHGEIIPAADDATMKNRKIAPKWGLMFAANDASAFIPVLASIYQHTGFTGGKDDPNPEDDLIREAVQNAYEKEFNERFYREYLARWKYKDIVDFRQRGFGELGKDLYGEYADALARFDLGLELLVYGHDSRGAHLFEVVNPGKIISHNLRGFAAIGSGSLMALAALNRKPLTASLSEVIYRLLDAKFSSETASDVGKKTHVIAMDRSGKFGIMSQKHIEHVRTIWEATLKQPEPSEALKIIDESQAVTAISDGPP
jgi:20S proteasome alpha/beta subunit